MTIVIGLNGLPGSGKDTVADHLVECHGFAKIAFADALKDELSHAFDVPVSTFNDRDRKTIETPILSIRECGDTQFVQWFIRQMTEKYKDSGLVRREIDLPRSPRWLMQQWGTEFRQPQNKRYWVEKVAEQMALLHSDKPVVITDVRFLHEVMFIDVTYYGEIWLIVRPGNPYAEHSKHSSNNPIPDHWIDRMLLNDGPLDDLYRKTDVAVKRFEKIT